MQQNVRTLYIIPDSITYKPTPANKFNRSCVGGGSPAGSGSVIATSGVQWTGPSLMLSKYAVRASLSLYEKMQIMDMRPMSIRRPLVPLHLLKAYFQVVRSRFEGEGPL
jgi:hypothetical protein